MGREGHIGIEDGAETDRERENEGIGTGTRVGLDLGSGSEGRIVTKLYQSHAEDGRTMAIDHGHESAGVIKIDMMIEDKRRRLKFVISLLMI